MLASDNAYVTVTLYLLMVTQSSYVPYYTSQTILSSNIYMIRETHPLTHPPADINDESIPTWSSAVNSYSYHGNV